MIVLAFALIGCTSGTTPVDHSTAPEGPWVRTATVVDGCDGYQVQGSPHGISPEYEAGTFCFSDHPDELTGGCDAILGAYPCPTLAELVAELDWFAPSEDERIELYRCVHANGVDVDIAEWYDTSDSMYIETVFWADTGLPESIRADVTGPSYGPGQQFCCNGSGAQSATFDPNPGVFGSPCIERIPYTAEDFRSPPAPAPAPSRSGGCG